MQVAVYEDMHNSLGELNGFAQAFGFLSNCGAVLCGAKMQRHLCTRRVGVVACRLH